MRRLLRFVVVLLALRWAVSWWRGNRRFGTEFVNRVVNPALMRRRLTGSGRSELGMLEHVGRHTGTRRVTPVHPEPTAEGFRIVAPLGEESHWASNVLAAGHCRLQLHDTVYELDEPRMVEPGAIDDIPAVLQRVEGYLGFRYLTLRTFGSAHGSLESAGTDAEAHADASKPTKRRRHRIAVHEAGTAEADAAVADAAVAVS